MATKLASTTKRLQIDKANTTVVIVTAISSFVVVFSLVASRALLSQRAYQARVIAKKEQARDQLKENIKTTKTLANTYKVFVETSPNAIGGNPNGTGDKDGNNAQIILDALPSSYDFPAVTSSLEKILTQNGLSIVSLTGTDDEAAQQTSETQDSQKPVAIPFEVSVNGSYGAVQNAVKVLEASIRPFNITSLKFSGSDNNLSAEIKAETYYQPATSLTIKTELIKWNKKILL